MGNSSSAQITDNNTLTDNTSSSNHKIVEQLHKSSPGAMVADVDISCIKQHLRTGKPSKEFMFLENEDFDDLDATIEAQKLYNKEKNRYTNILPCDSTRVKLSAVDGVEGSDYINANFIDGEMLGTDRAYIATQGPLMHTRCDFWRMVWENKCSTIIMLGKEVENDRVKCDRYWPEPGPDVALTFGTLVVRGVGMEEDVGRGIIVRRLEVVLVSTGEIHPITHFQYDGWPDHGVPPSAAPIRHLIHIIEKDRGVMIQKKDKAGIRQSLGGSSDGGGSSSSSSGKDSKLNNSNNNISSNNNNNIRSGASMTPGLDSGNHISPIVVHCSAGVGRTGTFCTIHMSLLRLHKEVQKGAVARFNLYNTVLKLRRQRPGMVQQQEQYIFCYEAVVEEAEELGLVLREPYDPKTPSPLSMTQG